MYDIVENNEDFVVVYKKPQVSFHSDTGAPGLFETVKQQEHFSELYPVHRLDKITSGLLVMAKTAVVNRELVEQFRLRQVEKYYLAISQKKPKKKQGLVKGDMVSARRGAWRLTSTSNNPAITQFFSCNINEGMRLFIIKPLTGKTHQIRVALKSLGAPIAGDVLYADAEENRDLDRAYLHAYSLSFTLGGARHSFTEAPREGEHYLSPNFTTALATYVNPGSLAWPKINVPITDLIAPNSELKETLVEKNDEF
jgi:tRNA pseudouridine32 synthase / 23S rRNA pseudouridine746 synthase